MSADLQVNAVFLDCGDERFYVFRRRVGSDNVRGRAQVTAAAPQYLDLGFDIGFDIGGRAERQQLQIKLNGHSDQAFRHGATPSAHALWSSSDVPLSRLA